ncbi:MAG: type II secretion system F family protein [Opitutaceae bacterium]
MNIHSTPPADFYRDLAILLGEGCSLSESIAEMSKRSECAKVRKYALVLSGNEGEPTRDVLESCPFKFDSVAKEALLSNADADTIIPILFSVAEGLETEKTLSKRVLIALAYPFTIFVVYLALLTLMQIFIIPVFREMFASFGSELPYITEWVMGSSKYMPLLFLMIGVILIKPIRLALLSRLPIFGAIYKNRDTMQAIRACLLLRRFISDNDQLFAIALQPFGVNTGDDYKQIVSKKNVFSPLAWRAITNINNPSSELLLTDLLTSLEHRHRNLVDRAAVISQVVSMVLIATLVGSLAFAVMAPIFQLSSIIQ